MEKLIAVILMAGFSTRFGSGKNKQLALFKGKPVFSYSILTFAKNKNIDQLIIVINESNKNDIQLYLEKENIAAKVILGGKTRQESVEKALEVINADDDDIVMIHDGARPLVDDDIINKLFLAAKNYGASSTYVSSSDTVAIKNDEGDVLEFLNRKNIALIQTPQAFKFSIISRAHKTLINDATDDCSLVLKLKENVRLIEGDKKLHKITTKEDILYLEGLMSR